MTDDTNFSSFLPQEDTNNALDDIERAFERLEQILLRHGKVLTQIPSSASKSSVLTRLGTGILGILLNPPKPAVMSEDYTLKNNRFPASSGQMAADLATLLRAIGSRNL